MDDFVEDAVVAGVFFCSGAERGGHVSVRRGRSGSEREGSVIWQKLSATPAERSGVGSDSQGSYREGESSRLGAVGRGTMRAMHMTLSGVIQLR